MLILPALPAKPGHAHVRRKTAVRTHGWQLRPFTSADGGVRELGLAYYEVWSKMGDLRERDEASRLLREAPQERHAGAASAGQIRESWNEGQMRAKALILDMDGVLIDSNPLHAQAWVQYLSQYDKPADSMLERMHGKRNDQIIRELFGEDLPEEEVFAHGAAKETLYRTLMKPLVMERLIPGVAAFLERHRGSRLGVASNAEPANVAFVLDEGGLRHYFSVIVDGHQVELPKPDPQIYLRVAAQLGVRPEECVIFEDSATGIQAGRAAGARVVAVRSTDMALPPTDFTIRDFNDPELETWLAES